MILGAIRRRRDRRAAEQWAAHLRAQLRESADIAITRARRELGRRMVTLPLEVRLQDRERVDVADVLAVACEHFGLTDAPAGQAAAILRDRFELRTGSMDLLTDAYEYVD
ncbi:hypothetical protein ABZT45_34770 [Streptomyces sp. NPDC005356]|uniref:hypothetical protein n=1 Tax=Streptomyces sp. NPDC005356 TaxID=3157167 RepID=UPI0033B4DD63